MNDQKLVVPLEKIQSQIITIRSERSCWIIPLLIYRGRNKIPKAGSWKETAYRFPPDFMFELSREEFDSLRSQFGTLKRGEHSKYMPMVFTEQGVAMLSSVLNSRRAIEVNINIAGQETNQNDR